MPKKKVRSNIHIKEKSEIHTSFIYNDHRTIIVQGSTNEAKATTKDLMRYILLMFLLIAIIVSGIFSLVKAYWNDIEPLLAIVSLIRYLV